MLRAINEHRVLCISSFGVQMMFVSFYNLTDKFKGESCRKQTNSSKRFPRYG